MLELPRGGIVTDGTPHHAVSDDTAQHPQHLAGLGVAGDAGIAGGQERRKDRSRGAVLSLYTRGCGLSITGGGQKGRHRAGESLIHERHPGLVGSDRHREPLVRDLMSQRTATVRHDQAGVFHPSLRPFHDSERRERIGDQTLGIDFQVSRDPSPKGRIASRAGGGLEEVHGDRTPPGYLRGRDLPLVPVGRRPREVAHGVGDKVPDVPLRCIRARVVLQGSGSAHKPPLGNVHEDFEATKVVVELPDPVI